MGATNVHTVGCVPNTFSRHTFVLIFYIVYNYNFKARFLTTEYAQIDFLFTRERWRLVAVPAYDRPNTVYISGEALPFVLISPLAVVGKSSLNVCTAGKH